MKLKISIAMATYNGARYLREQLESFSSQSVLPDELVVCDDGSTDETLSILNDFAKQSQFKVSIYSNPQNLGYVQNFGKALSLCKGDVIFLSDQDDIWYPTKLEAVVGEFEKFPNCLLIANDSDLVDELLSKSNLTLLGQLSNLGGSERQFVNGCGSALRKSLLTIALPIPDQVVNGHDGWLHDLGFYLNARRVIPDVFQLYRRHVSNTSQPIAATLGKVSWYDDFLKYKSVDPRGGYLREVSKLQLLIDRIEERSEVLVLPNKLDDVATILNRLRREQDVLHRRISLLGHNRLIRLMLAFFNYARGDYTHFRGWRSLLRDMFR